MYIYFLDGSVSRKLVSVELFDNGTIECVDTFGRYTHCGIDDVINITSGLNYTKD